MNLTKRLLIFCCLLASVSSYANTENEIDNTGWYVGGALGANKSEVEVSGYSFSEDTSAHQLYGGYNFNRWFGLEASFFLSGDVSDNTVGLRDAYFSSLSIAPKFTIPVSSRFNFFAKAGLTQLVYTEEYSHRYYDYHYDYDWYHYDRRQTWTDQVATYTLGAEWSINNHLKLRLVYDYTTGTIDEDDDDFYDYHLDELDVTLKTFSAGVHYQF